MLQERQEELFRDLSFKMLDLQGGDLMAYASLDDVLDELAELSPVQAYTEPLFSAMRRLVSALMAGLADTVRHEDLNEGIDCAQTLYSYLQDSPAAGDELPDYLSRDLEEILARLALPLKDESMPRPRTEETPRTLSTSDKDEHRLKVLLTFQHEALERLARVESLVLDLEKPEDHGPACQELFRLFHTIKGECGFLGLPTLGELAHILETRLDRLRTGQESPDSNLVDYLLGASDAISLYIATLDQVHDPESDTNTLKAWMGSGATGDHPHPASPRTISAAQAANPDESLIKIKANQVEYLVDMIGELSIALGQLDDADRYVMAAKKIVRTLQIASMQLGTIRVSTLFETMRRVVRDAAKVSGKEVDLVIEGDDIEVDRTLVEKLGEPFMHLLRNGVGHGIENSEQRRVAGKPLRGTISLSAERRGHQVVLQVRDDGRGIDPVIVGKKAIDVGLCTAERLKNLSREEIIDFIFEPGFSTATSLDMISGRGVGLDVVKGFVESMRGRINVQTELGKGTTFTLIFPINMAIIEGMIVMLGDTRYVIPVSHMIESIALDPEMIHVVQDNVEIMSLRGRTIPLIRTAEVMGLKTAEASQPMAVIVESRGSRYALLVDQVVAKKEVVIKPIGSLYRREKAISAGCILQGGQIGLVIDIECVIHKGGPHGSKHA